MNRSAMLKGGVETETDTASVQLCALLQRLLYLFVGLVLAQGVDGPDGRGEPADDSDLEYKADDAGDRAPSREEGEPREEKSE